ncbi:MAG: acetyl-CoA carboxylase, carboxyltransferase subunit beta [Alicyclobacillus sp.]|nr:acetyl-CoA carboxylase, carboxyltransferase subunit beta [Alicyclobacillus sp.]
MLKDFFIKKRHYATLSAVDAPKQDNIPKGLVNKCDTCGSILMAKELQKHLYTCPHCGHHFQIDARLRIAITLDEDCFFEYDAGMTSVNPLDFPGYEDTLRKAQEKTGLLEGVVTGEGTLEGFPVVIAVMDPRFIIGSMGSVMGEKITRAMERAAQKQYPFILFSASGGARMQEAILSLMQMAKTSAALARLHERRLLYVSVITHPTYGGVSASFASLGDVVLAEPKALFGFAGPRVIEQTIRQKLPDGFQTAEFMLRHGAIDEVVHRKDMRATLAFLLRVHALKGWSSHD